ncbi:hypothetical protein [Polaribacter sp. Hel_I_88]|uniref:hypothetical protein n=1 Tax=Polaribacter sp. Hel_I_88 TaxID=1250006 RepID=UPI00047942D0|nr:hypothetical protein [Polaribacter sp. Hel_I_88]
MLNLFIILIFLFIITFLKKGTPTLNANWNNLLDNFEYSTQDFYKLLAIELESNGIKEIKIEEKSISIGNALGVKRLYLRVKWKNYTYDCCMAPFGNGTFISWWMFTEKTGMELLLSKIPFIGNYFVRAFFPITYYSMDSASMFRTYAQASVLKVIDGITQNKGVRALSEAEKKPILNDIFNR